MSAPDLAHVRAEAQQMISETETITALLSQTEQAIAETIGLLTDLSGPAAEAAHYALSQCDPARGGMLAVAEALRQYSTTLNDQH